jgi:hypothetical protein
VGIPIVDLQAEDDQVLFVDGRVIWTREKEPTAESSAPAKPGIVIELDVSHAEAQDEISLQQGERVALGGQFFTGENSVFFELTRVLLDVRRATRPQNGISAEGFVGLEYSSMDVTMRRPGPGPGQVPYLKEASINVTALGPAFGAGLVWQPIDQLRLAAQARFSLGLLSEGSPVEMSAIDLGAHVDPFKSVGFYFGWRTISYKAKLEDSKSFLGVNFGSASNLDLRLEGPVLAVHFRI